MTTPLVVSELAALPVLFGVVYLAGVAVTIILSQIFRTVDTRVPVVCTAGARGPAYIAYNVTSVLSAVLLIAANVAYTVLLSARVPRATVFGWVVASFGIVSAVGMVAMAAVPARDQFMGAHVIISIVVLSLVNTFASMHIGLAFLSGAGAPVIALRVVGAVVINAGSSTGAIMLWLADKEARKRRELRDELCGGDADERKMPPNKVGQKLVVAAIGQYVALVGTAVAVVSLAIDMLVAA